MPSMAGMSQWGPGSVYGQPMNPFTESPVGSEYGFGHPMMSPYAPGMQMHTAPRNSVMTNLNDFSGSTLEGYAPPDRSQLGMPRPMSTFSLATTHNPFAGPSTSTNPTDEELLGTLRHLLSTQDLMTV
jgi:chitin synthase